jgi:hypothetical protein
LLWFSDRQEKEMAFTVRYHGLHPEFSRVLKVAHSNGDHTQRLMSNREFTLMHHRNVGAAFDPQGLPEMTNSSIGAAWLVIRAYAPV